LGCNQPSAHIDKINELANIGDRNIGHGDLRVKWTTARPLEKISLISLMVKFIIRQFSEQR